MTPPADVWNRWAAVRELMARHRLEAWLATDPGEVSWLTEFSGGEARFWLAADAAVLITDARYEEDAAEVAWLPVELRHHPMPEAVVRWAEGRHLRRVGFDPLTTDAYQARVLAKAVKEAVGLPDLTAAARSVKDAGEVARIRTAVGISEDAWRATEGDLRAGEWGVGTTEREVAARLEWHLRRLGSERPAFPAMVAFGERTSRPHARPGGRRLATGDLVSVDWGAVAGGLAADLTRVFRMGILASALREDVAAAADAVAAAGAAAMQEMRPGVPARQVDAAARAVLGAVAPPEWFGHGLGHGIGRSVHERPWLNRDEDIPLRPGQVFAVEPGLHRPGCWGVRVEDVVLVGDGGVEVLSTLPTGVRDLTADGR